MNLDHQSLLAAISKSHNLIDQTQREATAAHRAALAVRFAPAHRLHREWNAFLTQMRAVPQSDGRPNSAADQAHKVESLRIACQAKDHFTAETARLKAMSDEERFAEQKRDEHSRRTEQSNREMAIGAAIAVNNRPKISPAEFLQQLQMRGITLSLGPKGALLACPGALVGERDKAVLRELKTSITALLQDAIVVA